MDIELAFNRGSTPGEKPDFEETEQYMLLDFLVRDFNSLMLKHMPQNKVYRSYKSWYMPLNP